MSSNKGNVKPGLHLRENCPYCGAEKLRDKVGVRIYICGTTASRIRYERSEQCKMRE